MASFSWQRRQLLKALGASAAALPFYRLIENSVAYGQTAAPPMRLLLLYTGFGGRWEGLRPVGAEGKTDFAITPESLANSSLDPLKKYSAKMTVIRGLATTAALLPNNPAQPLDSRTLYLGHEHTCPTFFTGSTIRELGGNLYLPNSASLDYELGQQIGGATAVRSIQLGIGCGSGNHHLDTLSFDRNGQRAPGFSNPVDAFRQLFGNVTGGPGATDTAKLLKGQKSVLAAVQSGARRMRSRLAGTEKVKLDDHLAALADIETRLGATQYAPISCNSPTAPTLNRAGGADTVPVDTEIHFDMLTQAFACDRTRFVNAGWGNVGGGKLPWIFGDVDDMHGAVAHVTEDQTALGATARARVATLQKWYASRLCELMDRLNAVPESNGTLLDNTLIVWGQDFGEDIHGGLNVPYVLLGGAQGKLKMGRWFDYASPPPANKQNFRSYQPANKLFVSLLNAFGVQGDTFGSTEFPGPLTGIKT